MTLPPGFVVPEVVMPNPPRRAVAGTAVLAAALVACGAYLANQNASGGEPLTVAATSTGSTPLGVALPGVTGSPTPTGGARVAGAAAAQPATTTATPTSTGAATRPTAATARSAATAQSIVLPVTASYDARVSSLAVSGSAASDFTSGPGYALAQRLVLLTLDQGMTGAAMASSAPVTAAQADAWKAVFDDRARGRLDELVSATNAGSGAAQNQLFPVISSNVATEYDSRLTFVAGTPYSAQSVGSVSAIRGADADQAVLSFTATTTYHLQRASGQRYAFTTNRDSRYTVVKSGGSWLVHRWLNHDRVVRYLPEPGTTTTSPVALVSGSPATTLGFGAWMANPPGVDDQRTSAGLNQEYLTVTNGTAAAVDLTGYTITDATADHVFAFPAGFHLAAGASVRVHTGQGTATASQLFWGQTVQGSSTKRSAGMVWNNDGDTATLRDARGVVVDQCTYRPNSSGLAAC